MIANVGASRQQKPASCVERSHLAASTAGAHGFTSRGDHRATYS